MRTRPEGGSSEISQLIQRCGPEDERAFERLIPLVYDDLRSIARRRMRAERSGHTLDTTAVVHEAYLRLADAPDSGWRDRAHFFAVCARVIRHVLVDHARRRKASRRGGDAVHVPLREGIEGHHPRMTEILALEEALQALERHDTRLVRVVECRFFAGLTVAETADVLDSSRRTVERDWTRAKAYLYRALAESPEKGPA